jgi:hypothetical protein
MSSIVIGKSEGKNVTLDLKAVLRTHLLIWASTGGGKSFMIRRLAEQTYGKIPVIIIDREGEFATLREKFGFVLVGPNGETPADPRSAKIVAERLLEMQASAVCDLFELGFDARGEWVKNFYEALINAPKRLRNPALVCLDEAHTFAPEKGQGESVAYGAVTDFNSIARKRSIGSILATQRLSKLSKNATAEMYNQAAGPTAQQADRERAAYEMGMNKSSAEAKEFYESLRTLDPGNFFMQGRAISMDRLLVKVGPIETSHGAELTGKHAAKAPPTPAEVKRMLPKLADLPKQAEEKARTEAEFKKEIRSLKAQLRQVPTKEVMTTKVVADPKAVQRAVQAAVDEAKKAIDERDRFIAQIQKAISSWMQTVGSVLNRHTIDGFKFKGPIVIPLKSSGGEIREKGGLQRPAQQGRTTATATPVPPRPPHTYALRAEYHDSTKHGDEPHNLGNSQKRILKALAELEAIGRESASREMTAWWSGFRPTGGGFNNYLGNLKTAGLIDYPGQGMVRLTDAGREFIGAQEAPDQEEVLRRVDSRLGGSQRKILAALKEAHPEVLSRAELAERSGFQVTGGGYNNYLGEMKTAGLIVYPGQGQVACADWLFL